MSDLTIEKVKEQFNQGIYGGSWTKRKIEFLLNECDRLTKENFEAIATGNTHLIRAETLEEENEQLKADLKQNCRYKYEGCENLTERAEKAEAERDRLREILCQIRDGRGITAANIEEALNK